jgi:enterochelin esterase-like enzyme
MKHIFTILLSVLFLGAGAQDFHILHQAQEHSMYSNAMGKTMHYSVYVPKTMDVAEAAKYPVAFIFDRENERGCLNSVQAIDYLMASFAMPEFIVVTIAQQDRFYETSVDLGRKGSGGIDKFLGFVLTELDSVLKADQRANDYRLLIGHSRTAFLATYALTKYPGKVNAVIANSPFFIEPLDNPKIDLIANLKETAQTTDGARYYSCSVGGEGLDPHHQLVAAGEERLNEVNFPANFMVETKTYVNADHYTVVGMHTMGALVGIYSEYAGILSAFFAAEDKGTLDAAWLKDALNNASEHYGVEWGPQLVHVNSMASHFWQEEEYATAIGLINYGLEFYPKDTDLHSFAAALYAETGHLTKAKDEYALALQYVDAAPWYKEAERIEMRVQLKNELEELSK